ncbi:MAG: hypothetical protein ABJO27_06955 [Pseudoruegeria sp.]
MKTVRLLLAGVFTCLAVYLFVSAPVPLPDDQAIAGNIETIEVAKLFNAVNVINETAREIYTKRIVGQGVLAGFAFGEDWAEPGVEKGPLPALFLRLAANQMERKPAPLGLYLGSDAPINASNLFVGTQAGDFETLKATRAPVFSLTDGGTTVAMFPDIASAGPCVTCHNEHADSPKKDWILNDVMGATTWTYPSSQIAASDYLTTVESFFQAVEEAYGLYILKTQEFAQPIPIGTSWPTEGHKTLPNSATFMAEVRAQAADRVLAEMFVMASND